MLRLYSAQTPVSVTKEHYLVTTGTQMVEDASSSQVVAEEHGVSRANAEDTGPLCLRVNKERPCYQTKEGPA